MNAISGKLLVGNSFPFSLLRRDVDVRVLSQEEARTLLASRDHVSFWGHANTLSSAETAMGCGLKPATERPALTLDADNFPFLDGVSFRDCLICSPEYRPGFRPAVGEEVPPDAILGWHTLLLIWH